MNDDREEFLSYAPLDDNPDPMTIGNSTYNWNGNHALLTDGERRQAQE